MWVFFDRPVLFAALSVITPASVPVGTGFENKALSMPAASSISSLQQRLFISKAMLLEASE
jgi:hypothetical protein